MYARRRDAERLLGRLVARALVWRAAYVVVMRRAARALFKYSGEQRGAGVAAT